MKSVFTTKGNKKDAPMDLRFGRCTYFAVYDTETKVIQYIANDDGSHAQGAGINAAQTIIEKGAKAVVTGKLGTNAKKVLDEAGVEGYSIKEMLLENALDLYISERSGKL